MNILRHSVAAIAIVASSPAIAGEEVRYEEIPAWVIEAELPDLTDKSLPAQLVWDWQYRLEDGVVHAYEDNLFRVDNPQAQMQQNQQSRSWLPDKGDLTIHRMEIHRDGKVIDLIADGVRFEVLRRELGLESRLLDGELTATLSVPGLRVGDVLRIAHSTTTNDQALGDEVQALQFLYSEPWQVGESRVIMSWPSDEEMSWDVEDQVPVGEPEVRDGYNFLSVDLPLSKPDAMPHDAPYRFRRPTVLRAGSFEDWPEVSSVMAPHFIEASTLSEGSEVLAKTRSIMDATDDPLARAAMALEFVQEEVSYLLDGLDGGNYLPQHAEKTWEVRYGDCKAKTVLLLAMLQSMGIKSEALLVHSRQGDAVPELLPLPAAFDHVIVHSVIDGIDYWLDGTMTGSRLSTIADVPAFHYGLPIRTGGADLIPLTPRDPEFPAMTMKIAIDQTAGVDFPTLLDMEMEVIGPQGASMRSTVDEANPATLRALARRFGNQDGFQISDLSIGYDEVGAVAKVVFRGIGPASFNWEEGRLVTADGQFEQNMNFNPDRARPEWQHIPVATMGPFRQRMEVTMSLPEGGKGFVLSGDTDFEGGYGNLRTVREVKISDGVLQENTDIFMLPGEIAAADLPATKRAARRFDGASIELIPPSNFTWRWELSDKQRAAKAAPILAAYEKAIDFAEDDDFAPLQGRALFNLYIYDYGSALNDFNTLIQEAPSAWAYQQRSAIHRALGNDEAVIADLNSAYDLTADSAVARTLATRLAYLGRTDEASELINGLPVGEDDKVYHTDTLATLNALQGNVADAHGLFEALVAEQPQNSDVLNGDCWFRGLFSYALDTALARCTEAVEAAGDPYAALDSRALIHFRKGNYDAAIADLDAVLELVPGLPASLYLRGITRLYAGDETGRDDIDQAVLIEPYLPTYYGFHGIEPPR